MLIFIKDLLDLSTRETANKKQGFCSYEAHILQGELDNAKVSDINKQENIRLKALEKGGCNIILILLRLKVVAALDGDLRKWHLNQNLNEQRKPIMQVSR